MSQGQWVCSCGRQNKKYVNICISCKREKTVTCPFCNEEDFDKPGLKWHLLHECPDYDNTEELD